MPESNTEEHSCMSLIENFSVAVQLRTQRRGESICLGSRAALGRVQTHTGF